MIDKLLGFDRPRRVQALSGLAEPERWLLEALGGGSKTDAGITVNEESALACAAVKAAVEIRADVVAQLPLRVYEDLGDGRKRQAREHPVDELLHRAANGEAAAFNWKQTMQLNTDLWGNGYAEIQRREGSNQPVAIWQRSSKPERTKPVRRTATSPLTYQCRSEQGLDEPDVPLADMLHFRRASFDGLTGRSPVSDGRQTIGLAQGREKYASEYYGRSCRPGGVVTVAGTLSPEAYERTKRSFNENEERHRIQLLESGAEFKETQMNPVDVALIEAQRLSVEDIGRIYRVPLPLLQLYMSGMAYASVVELNQAFVTYTLLPIAHNWQGEINLKLLEPPFFAEFNFYELLKGDVAKRNASYRVQFGFGGLTINDFLRKENMNTIGEEGDRRFVPMNMIPLDRVDEYIDASIEGKRGKASPNMQRMQDAARAVLDETLRCLCGRQGKAAVRAAREPDKFLDWLDAYYEKERSFLTEKLRAPWESYLATHDDEARSVEEVVDQHIAESRELLLTATECQPEELERSMQMEVSTWGERRVPDDPSCA